MTGLSPAGLGYCKYSMTQSRPRSSKLADKRLAHHRLGGEDLDVEARRHHHPPHGLLGREAAGLVRTGGECAEQDQNGQDHGPASLLCPWRSYPRCVNMMSQSKLNNVVTNGGVKTQSEAFRGLQSLDRCIEATAWGRRAEPAVNGGASRRTEGISPQSLASRLGVRPRGMGRRVSSRRERAPAEELLVEEGDGEAVERAGDEHADEAAHDSPRRPR